MTLLTNKDINNGVIIINRGDYPEAKLVLEDGVTVNQGDLIQIQGRYTSEGVTEVVEDTDGYTVTATKQFKDDDAIFQTDGVTVNDVLWIKEGIHEGYYTVVSVDSQTQITTDAAENFTSTTALTYEIWTSTIFKGRITDKNFEKVKTIFAEDECESDIDKPIETTFYCGRLGGLVQEILDNECEYITHPYTKSSPYNYRAPYNFRNLAVDDPPPISYWDTQYSPGASYMKVIASLGIHKKVMQFHAGTGDQCYARNTTLTNKSGDIDIYVRFAQTNTCWQMRWLDLEWLTGIVLLFDSDGYIKRLGDVYLSPADINITTYSANVWYHIRIKYDCKEGGDESHNWHLWINDVSQDAGAGYPFSGSDDHNTNEISEHNLMMAGDRGGLDKGGDAFGDAFGATYDGNYITGVNKDTEYDELIYTTVFFKYPMTEKTPRAYFDAYCLKHQKIWYLDPEYLIYINDGDTDSLLDIGASSNFSNVDGKKQIKAIDKVIIKGGMVNGVRLISSYGAGTIVATDTFAHILDQDDLDDMAVKLYDQQSQGILKVVLDFEDEDIGYLQIGEEVTIIGNTIKFKRSEDYIATVNTQFKLRSERVQLGPYGKILYNELYLDDVLLFQIPEEEGAQRATEENSQLISEVGSGSITPSSVSGGGDGESNDGENVGTGTGLIYKGKSGVSLQFKSLLEGNGVAITNNLSDITLAINISALFENPPVEDEAAKAPTSEWAFDHKANNQTDIKHLTDTQLAALHTENHALATSGPHTGELPLIDLEGGTQGDIIKRGSADWEKLAKGTEGYRLRQGANEPAWALTIDDTEYDGAIWLGITDVAPSKNAVRNIVDPLTSATRYSGVWTAGTDLYPETQADDVNGATAGDVLTSAGHDFTSEGVLVNDILFVAEGADMGMYVITTVGTTTVTCSGAGFTTLSSLDYEIFRAVGGEYWICDDDGEYYSVWYEVGDWLIWNDTENQWDRIRNSFGDNVIAVTPGTNLIQAAIDEIESVGQGTVFLLPGTHVVTAKINILVSGNTNIKIEGAGDISIIDTAMTTEVFDVTNCLKATFRNFKIDAVDVPSGNPELIFVDITANNPVFIRNVTFVGNPTYQYGTAIATNSNNVYVYECNISNLGTGINLDGTGIVAHNTIEYADGAIHCFEPDNVIIGNHITECGMGITLDNNILSADRSTVTGNIINNTQNHNFFAGIAVYNSDYCTITGNTIVNNKGNSASLIGGIYIANNSNYNIISGNNISLNTNIGTGTCYGIKILSGCNYNTIGPNTIHGNGDGAIDNAGSGTVIIGDDTAYNSTSWDANLGTATKNAIRDEFVSVDSAFTTHKTSSDHNGQYYTEAEMNSFLHIGTSYKGYANLILDGGYRSEEDLMEYATANHGNRSSTDFVMYFQIGLPLIIGSLHLHVDYVYIYLVDGDITDYINDMTVYGKTSASTTSLYNNDANQTTPGLLSYPTGVDDWGDYVTVRVGVNIIATTMSELEISTIRVRYWYA